MRRSGTVLSSTRPGLTRSRLVDFQYLRAMGYERFGGAAVGEVLHTAARVRQAGGSRQAFIDAWTTQGRRVAALAAAAADRGEHATARDRFLRAYNYLRVAEFYFHGSRPQAHRALYEESLACFNRAVALLPGPVQQVEIPLTADVSMPGHLLRPRDDERPRPTVIVCGGGDGHGEEMYFLAGVPAALERGFNALLFHAPGQRGLLHRDPTQVFRPDAEVPIGAVLDFAAAQAGVDGDRLALYGLSFGGYHVLRAGAVDQRVAAIVANAPMPDMFEALVGAASDALPAPLRTPAGRALAALSPRAWNRLIEPARRLHWPVDATVENYFLWATGAASAGDAVVNLQRFALGGRAPGIRAPLLCLWASGEGTALRRRIQQLRRSITGPSDFVALTSPDGADGHCGVGNVAHTAAVVYDWLAARLRHDTPSRPQTAATSTP